MVKHLHNLRFRGRCGRFAPRRYSSDTKLQN